jgi:hypothetical protein
VDVARAGDGGGLAAQATLVDPPLHGDVGDGLLLEIALLRIAALLAEQGALDVDRVGVVALDEVGVVAVHLAHEAGERINEALRQAAAERGGALRELQDFVAQCGTVARGLGDGHRLHGRDAFAAVVGCRAAPVRFVRFSVRFPCHPYHRN